jgi:hypothetical protein
MVAWPSAGVVGEYADYMAFVQKKTRLNRVFIDKCTGRLFDLGFLVHHVLAHDGIKFLDLHFFGHVLLVLGRGVVVASAS